MLPGRGFDSLPCIMQILILSPITTKDFFDPAEVAPWLGPKTKLSHATLKRGPAAIESEADEKQVLEKRGHAKIAVIDPLIAAIQAAEKTRIGVLEPAL